VISWADIRWRQREVDWLLERLRGLVRERRALERLAGNAGALEANRQETERIRWKVSAMVKANLPRL
jgi:hypothetical protein